MPQKSVVSHVINGNQNLREFEQFYQQHSPAVLAFLRRQCASSDLVEDVLLEVFLAAWQAPHMLARPLPVQRAWLWQVARHKLVDAYRQQRPSMVALSEVSEGLSIEEARMPEQVVLHQEELEQVIIVLGRLPRWQQEAVQLRFVYGLSCAQIAAVQGKREGAVRKGLSRALNMLRALYIQEKKEV